MGHGNGWPSKYRDALYPPTQNGFGLNPNPGGDDYTHQYFGEASVGGQVELARNAIVLLNHLCYASGNSEPGLPEGNLAQAKQRVDNYAAGFIRAGAPRSSPRRGRALLLRQDDPVGQPLDPERLARRPSANRHRSRSRASAARLRRADGSRDRDVRASPVGRDEVRPRAARRPGRSGRVGEREGPLHAGSLPPARADAGRHRARASARPRAVPTAGSKTTIQLPFSIKDRKHSQEDAGQRPLGSDRRPVARRPANEVAAARRPLAGGTKQAPAASGTAPAAGSATSGCGG
jgi:hypothetical protein